MALASSQTSTLPPGLLLEGDAPAPLPGDMLGAYRIDSLAGEGGMGRVYLATHTRLGKRVAVKVLRRHLSRRPEAISRFFQEARAVNVIRHPNIVEITDFVEAPPGGDSYYIMEWLEGDTLAARLLREGPLAWPNAVSIARQVASALAAVHAAGIIHRDLKPENVYLVDGDDGVSARLLDFGVALLASEGALESGVAGTPAYFSPEIAAGRPVDARSDIYALGVMLYEMLAGTPPFHASTLSEYVLKHMTQEPRPVAQVARKAVPEALGRVVARCLAKDPERRYPSMEALESVLASLEDAGRGRLARFAAEWRPRRLAIVAGLVMLGSAGLTRFVRVVYPGLLAERDLAATLPAVASRVAVHIDSTPPGAEVYRDGMLIGTTPCDVRLPPGPQRLDLVRAGSPKTALRVDPKPGMQYTVTLDPAIAPPAPR